MRDLLGCRGPFEYMDQDVLNIIFENSWFELGQKFNHFSEEMLRIYSNKVDPVIVHFAGPFKPWHYPVASDYHHEWRIAEREYFGETATRFIESSLGYGVLRIFRFVMPKGLKALLRRTMGMKLGNTLI